MPTITVKDGPTFEAPEGKRLVLALEDNGVDILHRCGGFARCTTCRVTVLEGEPDQMTQAEYDKLYERGLLGTIRLSCQIPCNQPMTVEVLNRLSTSGLDSAGDRPQDQITPDPAWVDAPQG